MTIAIPDGATLRGSLERDGFVLIPGLLSVGEQTQLLAASRGAIAQATAGDWAYVRTVPKQFPPWPTQAPGQPAPGGIWGVQYLMHPALPAASTFVASYFAPGIVTVVARLLDCSPSALVMELYNLLTSPSAGDDFSLRWHRDDIPPEATPAQEEARLLGHPAWHAQWNLALCDDESLIVVPGSHLRARTETERAAGPWDPLPGEMIVKMKAGDVVFYNNNILHRAEYQGSKERCTLHGSMGHKDGGSQRARNVLQHGIGEWVHQVDLSVLGTEEESETRRLAEGMRRELVRLGQENKGDLGYSLEG